MQKHVSTWNLTSVLYLFMFLSTNPWQSQRPGDNDQISSWQLLQRWTSAGRCVHCHGILDRGAVSSLTATPKGNPLWMEVFYGKKSSINYGIHNLSHIYHWYPLWSYVVNYMGYSNTGCLTLWFWRKIWCFYFFWGGDWFLQWVWHTISVSIFLFVCYHSNR